VWFRYSPDRKGERPRLHLKDFRGILQADGYAGFDQLYQEGKIVEAACWAHARRKFYDILEASKSPIAAEAIERIGQLYGVEREIRGLSADQRYATRQLRAKSILDELHAWLISTLATVSGKSDLAGAIRYALSRWPALTLYCNDGRVEIDNNAVKRLSAPSHWAVRIICLRDPTLVAIGPQPCTACSVLPSSTAWISMPISPGCLSVSLTIRSTESKICYLGRC
jgi:hypothetical protein